MVLNLVQQTVEGALLLWHTNHEKEKKLQRRD